jgi:hypothetical protein
MARPEAAIYPANLVYMSPADERPRFPLLTRHRLMLAAAGVGFVVFLLIVGYVVWRHGKSEGAKVVARQAAIAQMTPQPAPSLQPAPSPASLDDQALTVAVVNALTAYNAQAPTRYKFDIKDGVITLTGETDNQAEKDGAENVIRPLAGVKAVVNNLTVKASPTILPVKLHEAEAKRLEEAFRKQILEDQQREEEMRRKKAEIEAQIETERQRREQAAAKEREQTVAKQREEEAARRKAAEERLQREAAEYERRLEEQRRVEAERRARAEQSRLETSALRSGTVAWSGIVDGVAEIIITGSSASVRHLSGEPPREARASFSAHIPRAPVSVKLLSTSGRGAVSITQEPSAANGYTTIVRIDDGDKDGAQRYGFTLRWAVQ